MIVRSPFPCFQEGERHNGLLFDWPEPCVKCAKLSCKNPSGPELLECSYGFNYQKISDRFVIAGFVVKDAPICSSARKKNLRRQKNYIVSNSHVDQCVNTLRDIVNSKNNEVESIKQSIIDKYVDEELYKNDFLEELKPEINKGLSFVHDYKQINAQIAQNINVIIESKYTGDTFEKKLESASHPELAIYWASKFLTEKLNVARFLLHPEWITRESESDWFRFHGLFIKYFRIYQYMFNKKNIRVSISGESYNNVYGNPEAIGVIIHTFLDNALKYARPNTKVEIYVADEDEGVYFSVSSYGPRIKPDEKKRIFRPFFRGEEAQRVEEEGAGYGLYIAQKVAVEIGTEIIVNQVPSQKPKAGHLTTFSVTIPYR